MSRLQALPLVSSGTCTAQADKVMTDLSDNDLAKSWVEFVRRLDPETGDLDDTAYAELEGGGDWAVDLLLGYSLEDPEKAYRVILIIAGLSNDEWTLASAAAGPLETIIRINPREFIPRLAHDLTSNPNIGVLVNNLWLPDLSADLGRELDHLRGKRQS
jgi:hypothetical protein